MNTTNVLDFNLSFIGSILDKFNRDWQSCLWLAGLLEGDNYLYLPLADVAVVLAREASEGGKHVVGRAQRLAQLVTDKGLWLTFKMSSNDWRCGFFSKPESREGQLRLLILLVVLGSGVEVGGEGLVDPSVELHQTLLELGRQWRQKHFGVCERVLARLVGDRR